MDNFPGQRYETKVESFECMMDNAEQEVASDVERSATTQSVNIDNQDNSEVNATITQQSSQNSNQMLQLPENMQQNMTLTPVRLPAILDGEFFTVIRIEDTNVTVRCLQCQKLLNGNLKSTGNFLSHIKVPGNFRIEAFGVKHFF